MNYPKVTDNKLDKKLAHGKGTGPLSISRRLVVGLIIAVVLSSASAFSVIYISAIREQETNLMRKADEYRDYLVRALELPLWNYDENMINTISRTFLQNELVVELVIKNAGSRSFIQRTGCEQAKPSPRLCGEVEDMTSNTVSSGTTAVYGISTARLM